MYNINPETLENELGEGLISEAGIIAFMKKPREAIDRS